MLAAVVHFDYVAEDGHEGKEILEEAGARDFGWWSYDSLGETAW